MHLSVLVSKVLRDREGRTTLLPPSSFLFLVQVDHCLHLVNGSLHFGLILQLIVEKLHDLLRPTGSEYLLLRIFTNELPSVSLGSIPQP